MLKRKICADWKFFLFFVSSCLAAATGYAFFHFVQDESKYDLTRFLFACFLLSAIAFFSTMKYGLRKIAEFLVNLGRR